MSKQEKKGELQSRFNYYTAPTLFQAFAGFLITVPISTFYLDADNFGLYALISSSISFLGIFASPATHYVLNKYFFAVRKYRREKIIGCLLVVEFVAKFTFLLMGLLIACAFTFLPLSAVDNSKIAIFVCLLVLSYALSFAWPLTSLTLILANQPRQHFYLECVRVVLTISLPIFLLMGMGFGEVTLYLSPLIVQLISLPLEIKAIRKYSDLTIDWAVIYEVLHEWRHSFVAGLFEAGYEPLERWFYTLTLSLTSLGLYTHAQSYLNALKLLNKGISRSYASILFAKFSSGEHQIGDEERRQFMWICVGLLGAGLGVIVLAPIVIGLITHGKFMESGNLVKIMYIIAFGFIPSAIVQYFLMSTGRSSVVSKSTIFGKLGGIFILYPLVTSYGLMGAAVSGVISYSLPVFAMIWYSYKQGLNINFILPSLVAILVYCVCLSIWN